MRLAVGSRSCVDDRSLEPYPRERPTTRGSGIKFLRFRRCSRKQSTFRNDRWSAGAGTRPPRRILLSHDRLRGRRTVGRPDREDVAGAAPGTDSTAGTSARRSVSTDDRQTDAAHSVDLDGGWRHRVDSVDDLPRPDAARQICRP